MAEVRAAVAQLAAGRPAFDPTDADDTQLVAAARADARAFALLYDRYVQRIYRYCHVRLGRRELAEDATSEVFLRALRGLPGYRGGGFAAWLFTIARHMVSDAQRRQPTDRPIEAAADVADPDPTPERLALARAEWAALQDALARLAEEQRTTLELQLAGWSGEAIARALGKEVAAVRMLRYRAVARLRQLLDVAPEQTRRSDDAEQA